MNFMRLRWQQRLAAYARSVRQRTFAVSAAVGWAVQVLILAIGLPTGSVGQNKVPLPVAGTMNFNAVYSRTPARLNGWHSPTRFMGTRFGGRLSIPVASDLYVGLAVNSWEADDVSWLVCVTGGDCERWLVFRGEVFATALSAQKYLGPVFLRVGAGPVRSDRYRPSDSLDVHRTTLVRAYSDWRTGVTVGSGFDLAVATNIYVSPSIDAYYLPWVPSAARELRWAVLVGAGLTIR